MFTVDLRRWLLAHNCSYPTGSGQWIFTVRESNDPNSLVEIYRSLGTYAEALGYLLEHLFSQGRERFFITLADWETEVDRIGTTKPYRTS